MYRQIKDSCEWLTMMLNLLMFVSTLALKLYYVAAISLFCLVLLVLFVGRRIFLTRELKAWLESNQKAVPLNWLHPSLPWLMLMGRFFIGLAKKTDHLDNRKRIIEALPQFGTDGVFTCISDLLQNDDNSDIRATAASAMASVRSGQAAACLCRALSDDHDRHVVQEAGRVEREPQDV